MRRTREQRTPSREDMDWRLVEKWSRSGLLRGLEGTPRVTRARQLETLYPSRAAYQHLLDAHQKEIRLPKNSIAQQLKRKQQREKAK